MTVKTAIHNDIGHIFLSATRTYNQYGYAGFTGSDWLFRIKFKAQTIGASGLRIGNVHMGRNTGTEYSEVVAIPVVAEVPNINVAEPGSTISGRALLEAIPIDSWQNTLKNHAKVQLSLVDKNNCVIVSTITSDNGGFFTFSDEVSKGVYRLIAEKPGYLRSVLEDVYVVSVSPVNVDRIRLLTGDISADNKVDFNDLLMLANIYGSVYPKNGYDQRADLNGDGTVDIFDLIYLARNYQKVGYVMF